MDERVEIDLFRGLYTAITTLPLMVLVFFVQGILASFGIEVAFLWLWAILVGGVSFVSFLFLWNNRKELETHLQKCVVGGQCPKREHALHRVREHIVFYCMTHGGEIGTRIGIGITALYIGLLFPVLFLLRDITGEFYI